MSQAPTVTDALLTIREAAAAISESDRTVERWIREKRIDVERVGPTKRVRIRLSVLRRLFPADCLRIPTQ